MELAHQADYSFTVYVRKGEYMAGYINYPSGGGRDLPDGPANKKNLNKIVGRMKSIFADKDKYIEA